MSVQPVTNSTTQQAAATTDQSVGGMSISPDAFLNILVTELQNQDPLDPQKPEDFLTQLASLTQVQDLTNIQSDLDSMSKTNQQGSIAQWLSTVGKKVNVQSQALSTGDQVTFQPSGNWDQIILTLTDSTTGNMQQVTFNQGDSLTYTYQGTDNVTFGATATFNGTPVALTGDVMRVVQGVQSSSSGIQLVLGDGTTVPVSAITEITQ